MALNFIIVFIIMIFYSGIHILFNPFFVIFAFIIVLLPIALINVNNVVFSKEIFTLLLLLFLSSIITLVTRDSASIMIESATLIVIFIMYLLVSTYKASFLISFIKTTHAISLLSILTWIPLEILDFLFGIKSHLSDLSLYYATNEGGRYTLFIHNYGLDSIRNYGVFWEPSLLALFIFTSLLFQEFLKGNNINFPRHYIFISYLTILSSMSSSGYIFMFLHLLFFNTTVQKNKSFFYPLLLTVGLAIFINLPFLQDKIGGFLDSATSENTFHYYNGRLNYVFMTSLFLQSPLFGIGQEAPLITNALFEAKLLNCYLSLLVQYGIFVFIYYNFLLFKSAKIANKNIINMRFIGFVVCFITINMTNNFLYAPNFYLPIIVVIAYSQTNDFFKKYI